VYERRYAAGRYVGATFSTRIHSVMGRFYTEGVAVLIRGGALIMGDQIVGYFVPGYAGRDHARRAIETGIDLLRATGNTTLTEPWIRVKHPWLNVRPP